MRLWRKLSAEGNGTNKLVPRHKVTMSKDYQGIDSLQIGQGTDIGNAREANEDAYLVLKTLTKPGLFPVGLLIVADGMGGHLEGEEASSLATKVSGGVVLREILLPALTSHESEIANRPIHEILTEAILSANQAVIEMESDAGTTLTVALVLGQSAYVAHVGDTRAYYLDDDGLQRITHDHSLVNRLVELGQISAQEAQQHPQRNFLYRALGQGPDVRADTYFQRLSDDSYLILCSDGLWNAVPEEEMVDVIRNSSSPQQACNRLIERANENGGDDNITILLARINYR
jgi:serine/threonine protein phosphatase PrpC